MAYVSSLHRPLAALALSLSLVACTTDVLTPSARIDGGERVGAIRPVPVDAVPEQEVAAYPSGEPVSTFSNSGGTTMPASTHQQKRRALPMIDSEEAARSGAQQVNTGSTAIPSEGVNMDQMLGVEPVVGLAEEQSNEIAEGNASQPVVGGIGEDNVRQLGSPPQTLNEAQASLGVDPDLPPLTEEQIAAEEAERIRAFERQKAMQRAQEPQQVAMLPRTRNPMAEPESQYTGQMPRSEVACRQRLRKLGVEFRDIPRISNGPSCGIDYPIELGGLSGGIDVKPAVKLNCEVTEAFAKWVKYELAPSSRYRYWSGVKTIKPLGGYSCRTMNSRRGNPMSEHAHGNAIDVGKFVLKNGKEIDVRKKGFFAFREKGLLKAVRTDSCKYFNTVLGPGSDPFHKDHFHFDLRTRKTGYRHCD